MNTFVTKTNEKLTKKYNVISFAIIILPLWIALAVYSLLQKPMELELLGICSACFALLSVALMSQAGVNNVFTLRFEGATLYLDGKTKNAHYVVYEIPASDIVLKQSGADKAANRCSLRIKNTVFNLKYVENYSELKAYIEANYPKQ